MLVLEDAHWLNRATADVLALVARRIEPDPVLLLAHGPDACLRRVDVGDG